MADKPYTIFLIDDDEDDRDFFKDALAEIGIETRVVTFNNGVGLIAHLHDKNSLQPEVIFLDLNMPIMGGEECLQKIRRKKRFDTVPIVIYSTSYIEELANRLKDQGANLYIQKPSTFSDLKSVLKQSIITVLKTDTSDDSDSTFTLQ